MQLILLVLLDSSHQDLFDDINCIIIKVSVYLFSLFIYLFFSFLFSTYIVICSDLFNSLFKISRFLIIQILNIIFLNCNIYEIVLFTQNFFYPLLFGQYCF